VLVPVCSAAPACWRLGALITSAIAALALVLAVWAAALIVAAMLFATAGIAALVAKKQAAQASPLPDRTVANVKQDIDQVKESRHAQ
jgi:Putative Actinobacterial Holin-X, holin superfamily III